MQKYFYHIFKELYVNYKTTLAFSELKKKTSSALDLWNVLGHFGMEIVNNLNAVRNTIKECLSLIFIPMIFTLRADKHWTGIFNKIVAVCLSFFKWSTSMKGSPFL
jgi:hypothetical protein